MKVADKVAIVTGGGNGIGAALSAKLAQLDARIVVADLDGEPAAGGGRPASTPSGRGWPSRPVATSPTPRTSSS